MRARFADPFPTVGLARLDAEPASEAVAQLCQEMYTSHLPFFLVHHLASMDFEVGRGGGPPPPSRGGVDATLNRNPVVAAA